MIKCNNCGFLNNDGSRICLNCQKPLIDTQKSNQPKDNDNDDIPRKQTNDPVFSNHTSSVEEKQSEKKRNWWRGLIPILLIAMFIGIAKFGDWWRSVDFRLVGTWQVLSVSDDMLTLPERLLPLNGLNRWRFSLNGDIEVDITNAHFSFQNFEYLISKKYNIFVLQRRDLIGEIEYKYTIEKRDGMVYFYLYDYVDPSICKITFVKIE